MRLEGLEVIFGFGT